MDDTPGEGDRSQNPKVSARYLWLSPTPLHLLRPQGPGGPSREAGQAQSQASPEGVPFKLAPFPGPGRQLFKHYSDDSGCGAGRLTGEATSIQRGVY